MSIDINTQQGVELEDNSYFVTKDGIIPQLDHPMMTGYKKLPKNYRAYTSLRLTLEDLHRNIIKEEHVTIMKVLGDAICCTEAQLRRYFNGRYSASLVSRCLDDLKVHGYVEHYHLYIRGEEDKYPKLPRVFVIGPAGYILLKHIYSDFYFVEPERWMEDLGIRGMQRYIAMNELRCSFIERKLAKNWVWNPTILNNKRNNKPFGVMEVEVPRGKVNFYIERAQMEQNFIGFFRSKLDNWSDIYKKHKNLPIHDIPTNPITVVLYVSTFSIAQAIHRELLVDTYPFHVWFCVEEEQLTSGLENSFYRADKEILKRLKLDFLSSK